MGARGYLWFFYGRIVACILAILSLITASLVPGRRSMFGGIFLTLFVAVMVASIIAVLMGLIVGGSGTLSERMSAPFSARFVNEAAELLGLDRGVARTRTLVGVTGSLIAISAATAVLVSTI